MNVQILNESQIFWIRTELLNQSETIILVVFSSDLPFKEKHLRITTISLNLIKNMEDIVDF